MAEDIDKEIEAIRAVLNALEPLSKEVRSRVVEYALARLNVQLRSERAETPQSSLGGTTDRPAGEGAGGELARAATVHIKTLKEQKKPRSANEMAALVAYYLANVAPPEDRTDRITTKDVETYFKIAEFRLPEKVQFTLSNAKAAGYLDAVGNGEYKLNAIGHNLVVHSLPRGSGDAASRRRKKQTRKASSGPSGSKSGSPKSIAKSTAIKSKPKSPSK